MKIKKYDNYRHLPAIHLNFHSIKYYEEAKRKEDIEEMKKYASRTSRLSKEMVEESKIKIEQYLAKKNS